MKHYEEPSMRVIRLRNDDVVATDNGGNAGITSGVPGQGGATFPPQGDPVDVTPGATL